MGMRRTMRAVATVSAVLLATAACGSEEPATDGGSPTDEAKQVNVYGSDGNMGNALGENFSEDGALEGMKGTTPLTELSGDFRDRLLADDPALVDFNYAAESYDAVTIVALAAETARSNDATVFAPFMNAITSGGDKCTDFATCLTIVQAGGDVDYDGQSGPLAFTDAGEPAAASFGVLTFGPDNKLDDSLTEYVLAGDEANASTTAAPTAPDPASAPAGGPLTIGTLLPQTGSLAFLGPPEESGVRVAIAEINAAGGALGQPVGIVEGDSGDTSTDTANTTTDRLLQANVNAIIGAASSGVSQTVIDKITGAGVVMFSPANTSDIFTDYDDAGLYFRTAPPDVLQARALADLIQADGNTSLGILALNDPYGTGLAENIKGDLIDDGFDEASILVVIYDPNATSFDSEVAKMLEFNPDGIAMIGFNESSIVITEMNAQGIGPAGP
ncbi:MAG: ABC transporter substrate-binding protein [Geodermatophilaceae bacterium]|nr:ABC transporter substrate-binding protein [Geodermatophilaceae bacterium]